MNKKGYTAEEAAAFLLRDSNLSEWQVGFLAVALDEVAEHHVRIDRANKPILCYECVDEITQMNSLHRGSIEPVVYAMIGLTFSVSYEGAYGGRTFFVDQHHKRDPLPRADFDVLHDGHGWGSDGHRRALRALFEIKETT